MPASAAGDGRKTALAKIYHAITNDHKSKAATIDYFSIRLVVDYFVD